MPNEAPAPHTTIINVAAAAQESVASEVAQFGSVDDEVRLGDLEIRRRFARHVMFLFAATNAFVMVGLGWLATREFAAITAGTLTTDNRLITSDVVMALLGATTVQLGTVIYTIARAIFPTAPGGTG